MKTTITKKLIAMFCAVIFVTNIKAQHSLSDTLVMRKQRCDTTMKHTNCIFEGKLISSKHFKGTDGSNYISHLFEVTEVIKGSLQKGTVEVVEKSYGNLARDNWSSAVNGTTLNFCSDASATESNSGIVNTNGKTLSIWDATGFSDDKILHHAHSPYSMFRYFSTMSQFYTYLGTNYNIKIDKKLFEKKSPSTTQLQINKALYEQKVKNYNNYMQYLQPKLQKRNKSQNTISSSTGCKDLYISEYLDGQGNNKSVEVWNPTNSPINLSNYSLLIYHGSSYTPTTIALTGTISAQSAHVVSKPNASTTILAHTNQTSNNLNFNGDEIIVLNKAAIHIDKIGIIGTAIGSGGWTLTPTGSTVNSDLRRKYSISAGDTSWSTCKAEWDVFSKDSVSNLGQHANLCGVDPDLNINFVNPYSVDSSNSKSYFEFDITAASIGASTYLDNAPVHIQYNPSAFGTNISANNKITVIRGSAFNTTTYNDPNTTNYDVGSDTVGIGFGVDPSASSWTRVLITSAPIKLMRVFIEVQNCNQNTAMGFRDNSVDSSFLTYYVAGQNDNPNTATDISYTVINYGSDLNFTPPCPVGIHITDFNAPVLAGVGNTLTIVGTGFGTTRGNGQVKFTDADNGGATQLGGLNANDYLSWNDTHIQINLPSYADSTLPSPNDTTKFIIGGNNFIVTNNSGQSATSNLNLSSNPFSIYFSLLETRNAGTHNKNRVNLRQTDTSGGYVFRLNPIDFPVGSGQRTVFKKAMQDWVCITGVNFTIGNDTIITSNPIRKDGVNYVFFASTPLLGFTQPFTDGCTTDISSFHEVDMQFSTSFPFKYDTVTTNSIPAGFYDFYETASHELGHAVGVEHNVVPSDLMYFNENTGNSAAQRKHLIISTSPADGGTYSVNHSISSLSSGVCWTSMTTGKCSNPNDIKQYENNNGFILFPNPSNGNVTIQSKTELGLISVYNNIGQLIYQQKTRESSAQIDLSQQAAGIYVVKVQNQFTKIIKD